MFDSVYENETRQGFETRLTLRTVNKLYFGVDYGYRYTTYQFRQGIPYMNQQSASAGLSIYSLKPVLLNFTYEGNFEDRKIFS